MFDAVHEAQGKTQRIGVVRVSYEVLRAALCLPPDAKILRISAEAYALNDEVALIVEHKDLNEVRYGHCVPTVRPMLTKHYAQVTPDKITFDGWSQ